MFKHSTELKVIGRVQADPDIRHNVTAKGASVGSFSVIVEREYKHNDEIKTIKQYYKVTCWDKTFINTIISKLRVDDMVVVFGNHKYTSFVSQKTGERMYGNEIDVSSYDKNYIGLLGRAGAATGEVQERTVGQAQKPNVHECDHLNDPHAIPFY